MNLNAKPPLFVPREHREEVEKLSKAALMDMVWDYAQRVAGVTDDAEATMAEFRATRDIILEHRKSVKAHPRSDRVRAAAQARS